MKDLYALLNVPPEADDAQIGAKVKEPVNPEFRAAARILLLPERRAVYDQVRKTMGTIGALRRRLDLTESPHWPAHMHHFGEQWEESALAEQQERPVGLIVSLIIAGAVLAGLAWYLIP